MYAVIGAGGKQYRVAPGEVVRIEKIAGQPGESVELGHVLALHNGTELSVGEAVSGAKVTGTIQEQDRGPKTIVFKFKRKKQYKRTIGHRQSYTAIKIDDITA